MVPEFAHRLIAWQRAHGRHHLPWQAPPDLPQAVERDPYPIWVAEIMLQQTQVDTVIPYYRRFMARFADLTRLAEASQDEVMAHWAGLGYYSRARNLHAAARRVMSVHAGRFPRTLAEIVALPGVGRSTAAAIAAFAYGQRAAILDGNVKRVLARVFGVTGWPGDKGVQDTLWQLAERLLPQHELRAYTQGLMDLGAMVCTRANPDCARCPLCADCVARRSGLQHALPAPRPRRSLPERSLRVLVLLRGGTVLLERRPGAGVWGGLWSLPECLAQESVDAAAQRLGVSAHAWAPLPVRRHAFTHFRLRLEPWRGVADAAPGLAEPGRQWLPLAGWRGAALPAPVRRLLAELPDATA